jgi:RNA polymerase sigma factor (sigma-70 family)
MSGSAAALPRVPVSALPLRLLGDDRLTELAAGGSSRAFAALYERHHRALYRYCRSIVHSEHDAQDVLQTTMTRALVALAKGPPDAPLRPWLFRIAHNEAVSLLRARRPAVALDEAEQVTSASVERTAEERARLALLVADLGDLGERQRSALVMRELSGLSHAEIATALGVSPAGAKQAIFEARLGLQDFAKGREMDCAEIQRMISDADGRKLRRRQVRAHVRSCSDCRALRDAIAGRRRDLAVLAPPLPGAAAAGLLARLLGDAGGYAGGGGAAAGAGKVAGATLAGKLAVGAAVLVTVGAGAPKLVEEAVTRPDAHEATTTAQTTAPGTPLAAPGVPGLTTTSLGAPPAGARRPATGRSRSARGTPGHRRTSTPSARRRAPAANGRGARPAGSRRPAWAGARARARVPAHAGSGAASAVTRATPAKPATPAAPTRSRSAPRATPALPAGRRAVAPAAAPQVGRPPAASGAAPTPAVPAHPHG